MGVAFFLIVWQLLAIFVHSDLILPAPQRVIAALVQLAGKETFWFSVAGSFLRVFEAFILSCLIGFISGTMSGFNAQMKAFMSPLITGIRATPVLALILLAMFWFPSSQVPVFSAILMAFPVMHTSTESGFYSVDQKLLEMANLFHVPKSTVFWKLRLPSALPFLLAGAKNALGLSWKVIVAGEILAQPRMALGTGMQDARLSLETSSVFAWAVTTILLCGLSEYLFGLLIRKIDTRFQAPSWNDEDKERGKE